MSAVLITSTISGIISGIANLFKKVTCNCACNGCIDMCGLNSCNCKGSACTCTDDNTGPPTKN